MKITRETYHFVHNIYDKRNIIFDLAKRDFHNQYAGSVLGIVWVYLQPLLFIAMIYIVFTFGFRTRPSSEIPFAAWLISGMIAWFFFSGNFSTGVNVIKKYNYLIKKVNFRLSILPLVTLLSSYIPHFVFVLTAIFVSYVSGIEITLYVIQVLYYLFAMSILLMGLNWLTSATNIFLPDVGKLVGVVVQFGFWLTPIFWNSAMIPKKYQWLVGLNPMAYIVNGYRDSIIYQIGFWQKPYETLVFWVISLFFCVIGALVFRKLRPHFAEVV